MQRHCWQETVSVELGRFGSRNRRGWMDGSPAIVVVAVDVEDLLALDTEDSVVRRALNQLQSSKRKKKIV